MMATAAGFTAFATVSPKKFSSNNIDKNNNNVKIVDASLLSCSAMLQRCHMASFATFRVLFSFYTTDLLFVSYSFSEALFSCTYILRLFLFSSLPPFMHATSLLTYSYLL